MEKPAWRTASPSWSTVTWLSVLNSASMYRRQRLHAAVAAGHVEQVVDRRRVDVVADQLPRPPAEGQREVDDAVARADVGDGLAGHVDVLETW
jgi:hypothetical protein